jgi:hypothetical protein
MNGIERQHREVFEKCSILFWIKECDNLTPPDHHRDRPEYLVVFRELMFEHDAACPPILSRHLVAA